MILDNGEDGIVYDEMIFDTGSFHSFCEHHMLQFSGKYFVGFVPNKKMIGLSKIARLVEFYSSKLQVQERLVKEIADELEGALKPKGLGVQLMASHSCKEIRGVKNKGRMITTDLRGCFKKDQKTREEFISWIALSKGD
jgi:GTP cyclohydrolase I